MMRNFRLICSSYSIVQYFGRPYTQDLEQTVYRTKRDIDELLSNLLKFDFVIPFVRNPLINYRRTIIRTEVIFYETDGGTIYA